MTRVLLDTGPLVASIVARDRFHEWARQKTLSIHLPILTCEPVLTEAFFLLRGTPRGQAAVLEQLALGVFQTEFRIYEHIQSLAALMDKYSDLPMSLTDACLVRMAELHDDCVVMTFDSHFRAYRRHVRQAIPLLMPPELSAKNV